MNHLTGLKIEVVSKWPSLKNFNQKENTMQYMTNQMMQRFMSNMSTMLYAIHANRAGIEGEIKFCKESELFKDELPAWYAARESEKKLWLKMEYIQWQVKTAYSYRLPAWYAARESEKKLWLKMEYIQWQVKTAYSYRLPFPQSDLQQMEKVVTKWLAEAQQNVLFAHYDYLENRYDTFYRNRSKQAKQKLAKLVELQQAIRKQKCVTRN